jgi:RND family efflux transporter MFP subunit
MQRPIQERKPLQGLLSRAVSAPRWFAAGRLGASLTVTCILLMGVGSWAQTSTFLGKVVALPDMVADVICPATGQILPAGERAYTVGDRVRKGDPLVVIANRYNLHDASHISNTRWDFWQQMMEARYAALEARVARERAERLKAAGSATGQQVAELRAAEQTAQANFLKRQNLLAQQDEQIAGTTLENRPVAAPIDGQISVANFTHGQMVYEELQLFRIVNLKQVGVAVRVPEASFQPWPVGTVARVRFDDLPGRAFTGKLEQISPVVDPQTRAREVQFRVENPDELLRFGMIGQVEVQVP